MARVVTQLSLALLALWTTAAHAFIPAFNQPCRAYECPSSSQTLVFKKDFVFTANGCGTAGLPIATKTDFSECCNWHDVCYSTCGMKKATCEKRLDKCMKAKCASIVDDKAEREQCESTTKLFALGAQMAGCPAFQAAQREACHCVVKSKAPRAIRSRLVHFLKTNGASAKDLEDAQVDALLAKYKGDEAKMFLRLAVKYPKAVKVDKTKKNYMDEIFNPPAGERFPEDKKNEFKVTLEEEGDKQEEFDVDEHIEL